MELIKSYATKNPCYKKATPMTPRGIIVHSTGANNPNLKRYVDNEAAFGKNTYSNHLNRANADILVHAFIGLDKSGQIKIAETLPYNRAAWGCGKGSKGSYNYNPTGHIQFEICEDGLTDKTYFMNAFREAAEYCAYLCEAFKLPVSAIVSHAEAAKKGYASNHADCDHWLKKHGKDMNWFRAEVQKLIDAKKAPVKPVEPQKTINTEGMFVTVKKFKNTSGKQLDVYADLKKSVKVGSVYKNETCDCLGTKGNFAIVMYPVTGTSNFKIGFADYLKGVQG